MGRWQLFLLRCCIPVLLFEKQDVRSLSQTEELDVPGEFWYDEITKELYVWPNKTTPDAVATVGPPSQEMVVPVLQTLIRFKGTAQNPVKDVAIQGVNFRDAAYTFMERFGVPSGVSRLLCCESRLLCCELCILCCHYTICTLRRRLGAVSRRYVLQPSRISFDTVHTNIKHSL